MDFVLYGSCLVNLLAHCHVFLDLYEHDVDLFHLRILLIHIFTSFSHILEVSVRLLKISQLEFSLYLHKSRYRSKKKAQKGNYRQH